MTAESTANAFIADARNFASSSFDTANDLVSDSITFAQGIALPDGSTMLDFNTAGVPIPDPNSVTPPPDFDDQYFAPTGLPTIPNFITLEDISTPVFPDAPSPLDTTNLFNTDKPVFDITAFSESPPAINTSIVVPDKPILNLIEAPVISPLNIGDVPTVTIPTFDEEFTGIDPGPSVDFAAVYKADYDEILPIFRDFVDAQLDSWISRFAPEYDNALAKLESKIDSALTNNSAITDAVEQSIFDRARKRAEEERKRLEETTLESVSKRGFELPTSIMLSGLQQAQNQSADSITQQAGEVAIERSKLELEHLQFVMNLSSQIRQSMVQAALAHAGNLVQLNGQALQHAQQVAALEVEIYNAALTRFEALQALLRTKAQVYEIRLKSAFAELEAFKIEIDAAKLVKEAEQIDVEIYSTRIEAEQKKINLFLAEIQGVQQEASLEKLKIELFGEQVRAYLAQVQGKEAEFKAFEAVVQGDAARVQAFTAEVESFRQQVSAEAIKVDVDKTRSDVIISQNKLLVDLFGAQLQEFITRVEAEKSRFTGSIQAQRAALDQFQTELSAELKTFDLRFQKERLDLDAAIANFESKFKLDVEIARIFNESIKLVAQITNSSAEVSAGIAEASVSAQQSFVSLVNQTLTET